MKARRLLLGAAAAVAGAALWWRKNPSACPYGQRFWVEAPHPLITRPRLQEILAPEPGERILEVGPGTGYYTLEVAEWVTPDGQVDILDLQQEMLDHTMGRAAERGLTSITPAGPTLRRCPTRTGLSTRLPGHNPGGDPGPGGGPPRIGAGAQARRRLVVGELLLGDPHYSGLGALRLRASGAGLGYERRVGNVLGYFARFAKS